MTEEAQAPEAGQEEDKKEKKPQDQPLDIPVDQDWTKPVWVRCPVKGYQNWIFALRYNYPGKVDEIVDRNTLITFDQENKKVTEQDQEGIAKDVYDWIIAGFKGILKGDGSPFECNPENKLYIIRHHKPVDKWIWSMGHNPQLIYKAMLEETEELKKT